jgi:CheY-like chemotaxis protein
MAHRVLIVDDEPNIRLLVREALELLEDVGLELFEAEDGIDAIQKIRAEAPDLVLLDLMMPRMNGYEVCEIVRADATLKHIPIVMVTARGQPFDREHGHMVGATHYMSRPIDIDDLLDLVVRLLDLKA